MQKKTPSINSAEATSGPLKPSKRPISRRLADALSARKKLPSYVITALEAYRDAWLRHERGNALQPSNQTQVAVPDMPDFSVLIYYTGTCSWADSFINPATRKRTTHVHGTLDELSFPEACVARHKLREMLAIGRSPHASKLTLNEAVRQTVFPKSKANNKKSLRDDIYRYDLEFADSIGHLLIRNLTPFVLQQEAARVRAVKNPCTAEKYVALLRSILRDLHLHGLLGVNLAPHLPLRKVESVRRVIASDDQLARIGAVMAPMPHSKTNDFFLAEMFCGARVGELLGAKFEDIDEVAGVLRLHDPKSGRPEEHILTPEFMAVYARRKIARVNEYLFPSVSGVGPMSYPRKAFLKLLEKAGVSGLNQHDFRRGFAVAAIQSPGVTAHDVSKLLRHSSLRVTEKHYLVAVDSRLHHAANQASRAVYARLGMERYARMPVQPSICSIVIGRHVRFVTASVVF